MTRPESISAALSQQSPDVRDRGLIARVLAGERERFHDLVRPYEKSIYFAAYSLLQNQHDAEEVAQEAVLKALKNLHTFRAEARFSTWLTSIALNEARGRLRHDRLIAFESADAVPDQESGDFTPALISDWREVPSDALERKELREMLQRAIQKLPEIYREVLILRDMQDCNIAETAATLGVSEGVVKTRLLRARLMMQKELAPKLNTGRNGIFAAFKRQARGSWF
ncbi:MAG TPA: sigma-70 family RNA polymerase sigma factor [Candidatus Angelobacter sp.]|jgi:RNA polymerase sigma-70 factor (ECF subfamily)|nr:sigma-70 family RNA polymerase sigma factor [Candidatus Angelobacter sp.]